LKHRYTFYWILWGLGELSGLGQWLLLRWALPVPAYGLLLLFLLLPFIYLVPNILANHLPLRVSRLLARVGGYWFVYGYYMTMLLVPAFIVWLVRLAEPFGFGLDWWQSVFAVHYGRAALLGLALLLAVGSWRARHPVVRIVEMKTAKPIERAFSVAFASDIHLGAVLGRSFAAELRRDMMKLRPDLILLGGDIIDGNLDYVLRDRSFKGFEGLKAPWGVYAVFGNHDTYGLNLHKEQRRLQQSGVRCLRGGTVHLAAGVSLVGLEDYMIAPHAQFPQAEPDAFTIAMEHEPLRIEQASSRGMDLYFAGHTHAGQFWPNRLVTRRIFPLDYGARHFGRLLAIVSSGYGAWGQRFRIGPAPEIVLVKVVKPSA
jgi:predicted MPP superfamily phosphohydrolase